ncbi:MAG: caspase family protein [Armatimonas sp.]
MKRLSVWASLLFPVLCLFVFLGCGGGGDDSGTPTVLQGRVEGYAYLQGGTIVIGNTATPPAGANALSGANLTIDGKSGSASTEASGHFLISNVPVGQRKLHVSGGGAPMLDLPLTVVGSATISPGVYAVSRSQAVDLAKTAAAGLGTVSDFQIMAPQQPLPTGTVVKPALGNDDGADDPALTVTLSAPHYLVFVDQQPGARFQHPAAYYLIDAATGGVAVRNVSSWPRINSVNQYSNDDLNATAQDLVQEGTRKVVPPTFGPELSRAIQARTRDHVPDATDPKTYALLILGNTRSDMATDLVNVKAKLFGPGGLSGANEITTWEPAEEVNTNAVAQIKKKFEDICAKARPEDTILIYISSHGTRNGGVSIQQGVEADNQTTDPDYLFPFLDLNTSLCAACHAIFIVDTCFSGGQMVEMAVKSPPHVGQKLTFIASSSSAETSAGITTTNNAITGKRMGGVFTNAFLDALKSFSDAHGGAGQGNLQTIFDDLVKHMPDYQHPQTVFKWDGSACGGMPTYVTVTPTPQEGFTAKHTVGTTSCPQTLGNMTLTNVSDHTVSYNLNVNSSYFNLGGGLSGSLSPGQSKSLGLSFNCGKVPPLTAAIGITATAEGHSDQQSLSVPVTLNSGP